MTTYGYAYGIQGGSRITDIHYDPTRNRLYITNKHDKESKTTYWELTPEIWRRFYARITAPKGQGRATINNPAGGQVMAHHVRDESDTHISGVIEGQTTRTMIHRDAVVSIERDLTLQDLDDALLGAQFVLDELMKQ